VGNGVDLTPVHVAWAADDPWGIARRLRAKQSQVGDTQAIHWIYLGREYSRLIEWEEGLGSGFERVSYSERLQLLGLDWRDFTLNGLQSTVSSITVLSGGRPP